MNEKLILMLILNTKSFSICTQGTAHTCTQAHTDIKISANVFSIDITHTSVIRACNNNIIIKTRDQYKVRVHTYLHSVLIKL